MPRIEIDSHATVREGSSVHRMRVHDISQGGVKLSTSIILPPGSDLVVSLPGLDSQPASVRWNEGGQLGATFNRLLPLADLVAWLHAMREELRAA